ncbi:MAG TPA: hypothetical protein VFU47_01620 [Armatimonadota bacterium]|nr:hypothetical protein [Armatimonadota bacterium]
MFGSQGARREGLPSAGRGDGEAAPGLLPDDEIRDDQCEGAFGETLDERSVVPPARQGIDAGSPSGGVAGGTPAREVRDTKQES